jgi:hypothetical protein
MKRYFWLVMGTILGVVAVVLFLQLSESQKRRIIYMVRQVPYLPARYYV